MNVRVNGDERDLAPSTTVADLVELYCASPPGRTLRGVAVAVDGEVLPRGDWASRVLTSGATVEVLIAVPGG